MRTPEEIGAGLVAIAESERIVVIDVIDGFCHLDADIIDDAIEYIELLESNQKKWFPAFGRDLPACVGCDCLILVDGEVKSARWDHNIHSRRWCCYEDEDHVRDDIRISGSITHWMPLPDAPKAGENSCG